MAYIKPVSALKKLEQGAKDKKVVYITGAIGMGKTAVAEYYFRRKRSIYLHGEEGYLNDMPEIEDSDKSAIIFDDVSQITDEESQKYIIRMTDPEKRQVVLIGRGNVPNWLMRVSVKYNFIIIDDEDLALPEKEIAALFEHNKAAFQPDTDEFKFILERCWNNNLLLFNVAKYMPKEETFVDSFIQPAKQDLFRYLDHVFFDRLDRELQNAVLELCLFDKFNVEMIRMITADPLPGALVERMHQAGHFIGNCGNNCYRFEEMYREYLLWKQSLVFTQQQVNEIYDRAAIYFELSGQPVHALECYRKNKNEARMTDLLIKIVGEDPCMKNFRETKEYFEMLPPAVVAQHPMLMFGMSSLYSLAMDPSRSDFWYNRLKDFLKDKDERSAEYKGAESLLRFLDATLYHRDKKDLVDQLRHMEDFSDEKLGDLYHQMSVIDFTPSILNGTVELSESMLRYGEELKDKQLQQQLESYFAKVFGPQGASYLDLAITEYLFESCQIDSYELNMMANEIYMKADIAGAMEICFVAISLLMRDYLDNGNYEVAESTFEGFREKLSEKDYATHKPGLDLLRIRLDMYKGHIQKAREWLETAPSTTGIFTILDRQLYIMKLKILISLCRYEEALALIGRLAPVFETYHRPYNAIQNNLFKAVLLFRTNNKNWQSALADALVMAEKFNYYHLLSEEGIAISPLLEKFENNVVSPEYFAKLKELTDIRAKHYPDYMASYKAMDEPLTDMEHKVISMMCSEMASEEICKKLNISYSGLKFHRQNIYRKLSVNNRHDAQRVARSLGLNLPQ